MVPIGRFATGEPPVSCFSVNLSRLDFRRGGDERLFDRVVDTLSRYDVPRQAIKLEITQSLMLEDIDTFRKLFRQFRDAGFTLWIDDFGSGYSSIDALERAFNDHRSDRYLMIKKLVTDTISLGTRQTVEYVNNDVCYRLSAKCLAKKKDKAMLALRLITFDSEREIQTAKEMLNYGNSLFSTYELVVVMYPDSGISKRIYTANSLPSYDQAGSLSESFRGFCESEVMPVDQARYLRFMDYETINQRVEASPKGFIQSSFRLHWDSRNDGARADSDVGPWYTARVSRIPASAERAYLLTIQSHPANEARHLDVIARDHPEILE